MRSTFDSGLSNPLGLAFNSAGDLFVADNNSGNIFEYTPGGVKSTFASGLDYPDGLAFNSTGELFEGDGGSSTIYEFTAGGVRSPFANVPGGSLLAFQPVPEPSFLGLLAVGTIVLFLMAHRTSIVCV